MPPLQRPLPGVVRDNLIRFPFYEPPPPPEDHATSATFAAGVRVELRREGQSRWLLFVGVDGQRLRRRKDFATPYLDHGRRSAECFYGAPLTPWSAPVKDA